MIKVEFSASYSLSQFTYHSYCPEYIYCHFTVKRPNKLLKHNSFPFLPCPTNKKKKKKHYCSYFYPFISRYVLAVFQEILEGVTDIDLVVNLKLREEALLAKCLGRRTCSECGGSYNIACIDIKGENGSPGLYMAPLLPPPHCESKLITRADDTEEVVKERLRIYRKVVLLHTL
jgi:hypothetical protein